MPAPLAICCATRGEPRIWPFLRQMYDLAQTCGASCVLLADGQDACARLGDAGLVLRPGLPVHLAPPGTIHTTMQHVISQLPTDYVLLLDDDESCPPAFTAWLVAQSYRSAQSWLIPRAWLWPDAQHFIVHETHWPDYQHRLAVTSTVRIPIEIHGGWIARGPVQPALAPHAIAHHKLLIRTREERYADMLRYDQIADGAGSRFHFQYLPDEHNLPVADWADGAA